MSLWSGHIRLAGWAVAIVLSWACSARGEIITLRSGNGTVGSNDSLVNMLVGPADSAFASAFTAANFTSAQTGPDAFIISPNGAWISGLISDSQSKWIGTSAGAASEGSTALYAISFVLSAPFSSATLDLHYAVDNVLGGGPNQGVFLNGTAISGNSTGGTFTSEFTLARNDIGPLLSLGTNTLYINATDQGGPAGLLFRATITTESAIPEPSSFTLVGLGVAGLIMHVWRRRRLAAL
jgi:PEP-CTERM motif